MSKPKITIKRSGQFDVPGIIAENQCGRLGQTRFNFRCEITVDRLDDNGFVCDNFRIPLELQSKFAVGKWQASCEQLAGGGIYLIHKLCQSRALRIVFEVSPINEASVAVEWSRGDEMPEFWPKKIETPLDIVSTRNRRRMVVVH